MLNAAGGIMVLALSRQMISYAQNFEDVILSRVFREKTDGFYIDVGAMDPTIESATKAFYDRGWSGINIEPNPSFYEKLTRERPRDINLNLALADREEHGKEFFLFENIGNSTFDAATRDRYLQKGFESKTTRIEVSTLAKVCEKWAQSAIDFLKIDCEAWEKFVIQGADWERFRPTVVLVEATEPGTDLPSWQDWEPQLLPRYEMVYFDGLNRFYLDRQRPELRKHFESPPSWHDNFKTFSTVALEWARDTLTLERDTANNQISELHATTNHLASERNNLLSQVSSLHAEIEYRGNQISELTRQIAELHQTTNHLAAERAESISQIGHLHAEVEERGNQIANLTKQASELKQRLLESRLWIGQLSQELAASKNGM